ncbi:MAG: hypothetical protein PWQ55_1465 [Chloroflexota bacterium]|nr:hypothetical protein [Chloroflexota bacterium]
MKTAVRSFLKTLRIQPLIPTLSILTGLSAGWLVYVYHLQLPLFSRSRLALCLLIALAVMLLAALFLVQVTLPILRTKSRKVRIAIVVIAALFSLLLSVVMTFNVPHIYAFYTQHTLVIDMDLRELPAGVDGVSFSHLQLAYRNVSYSELDLQGDYQVNPDSIFFPAGQTARINWQGITGEQAALYLRSTSAQIPIQITWDGQSQVVDLSSGAETAKFAQDFAVLTYENLLVRLAIFPLVWLVLLILLTGLFSPHPYAYILLLIWLFIFFVFYPGIIGSVNISAVDELRQGHPTDWHPIVFTLLMDFLMRYFASASSMLLVQIIALAALVGHAFSFLNRKGVSNRILILVSVLLAILPTNFLAIITLTNDIPYSIALMALTYLAFRIVISKGQWLQKKSNLLLLTGVAALSILLRYNGIPAVGFFFVCLLIIYPQLWKKSLLSLAIVVAVWLFVSGPFSSFLNVTHDSQGHFDNILLHHISAHVANGTPMSDEESAYLNTLLPLDEWKYSCCTNAAMWANDDFDRDAFHDNSAFNRQLEIDLFRRNPGLEVSHMLCASDIVWNVYGGCEIKHPFVKAIRGEYFWTRSYMPAYQEASFLSGMVEPLSRLLSRLDGNALASAFLWHPAWYFYAAILCTVIFSVRSRSWRGALVLTPALGQSLFLLLFNRVQNFRYQYCIVLVGFLLIAIAFYKPPKEEI